MDIEIITSRDLAENRGWPGRRRHGEARSGSGMGAQPRGMGLDDRIRPGLAAGQEHDTAVDFHARLDCRTCTAPASACADCVMGVLLQVEGPSPSDATLLTAEEQRAVEALTGGGLLPPLRHRSAS